MIAYPILWDSGVYLPEQGLWLDPRKPRPRAVISHAHSDHVAAHPLAYATAATRRLVTHRRRSTGTVEALSYGQTLALDRCAVTLYPAGHVLGSAQTLVETDFGRVLYTGDLKTRAGFTSAVAEPVPADVLVTTGRERRARSPPAQSRTTPEAANREGPASPHRRPAAKGSGG